MNININIDINMNIDITPPHPHPMLGPSADGAGGGMGVGWGDININIDINMNIDIHIIINMNRQYWYPQAPLRRPARFLFLDMPLLKKVCFSQYVSMFCVFTFLGKHQIDTERIPVPKSCRNSSYALM